MSILLTILVIVLYTMQSFLCKKYTDNYPGDEKAAPKVFTIISASLVAVITFAFSGFVFSAKPLTVLLGLINAFCLFGYNYFIVKSSQHGPYSVLIVFSTAGGIIIPAVVAAFAFDEKLSPIQIASIAVIFVAVWLISQKESDRDEKQRVTKLFIILCLGLAICNGAYGMLLDIQQRLTGSAEKEEMVAITFLGAALLSLISMIITDVKSVLPSMKQSKASLIYLLSYSIVAALAINVMVYVFHFINIAVFYTFDNSGVMLLSVLCSYVFFKEKLSMRNIMGCALMCAGLICLSVF